jgi:uncharacterized protein YbjT (DUF2867 family)
MRILVVGAYGLIGFAAVRALLGEGHDVVGAGRNLTLARRLLPGIEWLQAELGRTDASGWAERLQGIEVVVNAAGALQDGLREDMAGVHVRGLEALVTGCRTAGIRRLVHISAVGVGEAGGGSFNDTKLRGETIVEASGLEWIILRPALVFGPAAFGGTALLRGLAGFPGLVPAFAADASVQVVSQQTVAEAIARAAVQPDIAGRRLDLAGLEAQPLADVLRSLRAWLGLRPAPVVAAPRVLVTASVWVADALGWLGWRNPMRSNAVGQIERGMGSAGGGEAALGLLPERFVDILDRQPATLQERRFARLYFAKPALLIALSTFSAVTGAISLARFDAAVAVLSAGGLDESLARVLVVGGALIDIALAIAIAVRAWTSRALIALIGLTAVYLAAATAIRPDLWLDPMGGLTKAVMIMLMAAVAWAMLDDR